MSEALYQSFLEATREVFRLMLDLNQLTEKNIQPDAAEDLTKKLCVAIGVTGSLKGKITYIFPNDAALQIVKIMSGGMEFTAVDDFVTSAICEIANIISGKALMKLSERNIACDILPPQIVPNEHLSEAVSSSERSVIGIQTDIGDIKVDIQLGANQG